ncbi:hypothetical protein TthAA37_09610 [Thermus thermophilus]|uniref:Uncharacterized protein n=1 Tax=Thermus thermophilus TaxID=274 RepID=A0AAD1KTU9_THETH|nr:hypothetical protein TthAA11_09450 [Thermus thermophilus]BCZ89141.1 hypothetical protein TthAA22_09460 [Thermus thermophilus]BCZ91772.1 hypothetical protein TthAA37_09610 [Thermus thermophilus]BCZ94315.1 hypothetical protein TthAK1_09320 [Thermus thermophilus]
MRRAIDALLLAVIRALLRVLTPGGRVDALYAVNRAVDWDLYREEQGAKKTAPALEGRGR